MKILVVCRSSPFHPGAGGMERVAYDLVQEWQRRGHEVSYITTRLPGTTRRDDLVELAGKPGRYTRYWARQVGSLSLDRVDVVLSVSSAGRRLVANPLGVPVIMQAHGTSLDEIQTKLRLRSPRALVRLPKNLLWLAFDSLDYPKYAAVVGVGPTVTRALKSRYPRWAQPRRYSEIRNGVRPSTSRPATSWEHRRGVVFVGRLHEEKGLDVLLQSVVGTDISVTVCGDGPEREVVQELARSLGIADRVRFLGQVSSQDVRSEIRRARVLAVPTRRNEVGLPLTILESLVEGTPVVASPLIGSSLPKRLSDGYSIASDSSVAAFREALLARVNQAEFDVESLRRRSDELTIGPTAEAYLELFDQLTGGNFS